MLLRLALILSIPVLSVVFALMTSGLENVITADNPNWRTIPIFYWLSFWATAWFAVYHFKFGTTKKLKMFVLRTVVRAKFAVASHVVVKTDELNRLQKRSAAIWDQMLKDRGTTMMSCLITNRRMLRKDRVTCIITTGHDVNFVFIRSGGKDVYFEVYLPNSTISSMFKSFDKEQRVRFDGVMEATRELASSTVSVD